MQTTTMAKAIRDGLGIKARTKMAVTGSFGVLDLCCLRAEQGDLPYGVYTAAYGIAWAMKTGRLDGTSHKAIEAMTAHRVAGLVAAVAGACGTIGEVPGWLMGNRDAITA